MTRAIFLAALVLILAGLAAVHNRQPNAGLPIVQSSVRGDLPAWRLYTPCPVSRRNIPVIKPEERT